MQNSTIGWKRLRGKLLIRKRVLEVGQCRLPPSLFDSISSDVCCDLAFSSSFNQIGLDDDDNPFSIILKSFLLLNLIYKIRTLLCIASKCRKSSPFLFIVLVNQILPLYSNSTWLVTYRTLCSTPFVLLHLYCSLHSFIFYICFANLLLNALLQFLVD